MSFSRELGVLERLSGEAVSSIIHQKIQLHVDHTCKGNFEQAYIQTLEQVGHQQRSGEYPGYGCEGEECLNLLSE